MRTARKQQCSRVLRNTFGVSGFRPGQEQAADALLDGRDLLCILPTGAGKSLCWQLPALMMDELTVVISPLIVLMHDQVRHLRERGIPSVHLDSLMTPAERADALNQLTRGQAKIAFLAPERLNHPEIHALCQQRPPAMVVVDEAHCVVHRAEGGSVYQMLQQFTAEGGSLTGYADTVYADRLALSAQQTGKNRCALLAQCERQLLESCTMVPLMAQQKRLLLANGVRDLVFDPFFPVLDLTWAKMS